MCDLKKNYIMTFSYTSSKKFELLNRFCFVKKRTLEDEEKID